MTNETKLLDLARQVCDELEADALDISAKTARGFAPVVLTLFRPYVRAAVSGKGSATPVDGRVRTYSVTLRLWNITTGEDDADFEADTDPEQVQGLAGVWAFLSEVLTAFHEEAHDAASQALRVHELEKREATLRTALTRGNGKGEHRVRYAVGKEKFLAHATVEAV